MQSPSIILVNVGPFFDEFPYLDFALPLGTLSLGSYLHRRGIPVILLDTRQQTRSAFTERFSGLLPQAAAVGFSVMTPVIEQALHLSKITKRFNAALPVIWGGTHPSLFPESTINNPNIDFVVRAEGEKPLLLLSEHLLRARPVAEVPNLWYKTAEGARFNPPSPPEDLGDIGIPDYDAFDCSGYVQNSQFTHTRKIDILSSRGCRARCTFCINSILHKSTWRVEPLQQTIENIDQVRRRYGVEHICFTDEDFFSERSRILPLAAALKERKLTWEANCRAAYFGKYYLNDEMLQTLAASGCKVFRMGLESGSPRILRLLKKGISPRQGLAAVRSATRNQILVQTAYIMGLPGETRSDILKTFALMLKVFRIDSRIELILWLFRPYPGSILFQRCLEKGLVEPASLTEWSNFFMPVDLLENTLQSDKDSPWFPDVDFLKRGILFKAFLAKNRIPPRIRALIAAFHLWTGLHFIQLSYILYKRFSPRKDTP